MPPEQVRRLACLALAVEMQRTGDGAEATITRAAAFSRFVMGNPYAADAASEG